MFPVDPHFGKMLANGMQHNCLPYVIAMVSGLSVGDPFLREDVLGAESDAEGNQTDEEDLARISHLQSEEVREKEKRKSSRKAFYASQKTHGSLGNGQSDIFKLLSVIGAYEFAGGSSQFCREHFVRPKVCPACTLL
jgi:ATP-dependent RNA helicase DHX37/DHR1